MFSNLSDNNHLLLPKSNIRLYSVKMYTKTLPRVINQKWKKWKYIRKRLVSIKIEQIFYAFTSKWSKSFIHYFIFCCKNFFAYQVIGQMPKKEMWRRIPPLSKPMQNQNCREEYVLSCKININYISNYTNLSSPKEIANRMVFVLNVLSNQENCCWLPPFFILNDH